MRAAAVVYAEDLATVAAFYEHVGGLAVELDDDEDHVVLGSSTLQLVVVEVPAAAADAVSATSPPARREDAPIKLVLDVPDLAAARAAAPSWAGSVDAAEWEWDFLGHTVCDATDPEGNLVQLREVPT